MLFKIILLHQYKIISFTFDLLPNTKNVEEIIIFHLLYALMKKSRIF